MALQTELKHVFSQFIKHLHFLTVEDGFDRGVALQLVGDEHTGGSALLSEKLSEPTCRMSLGRSSGQPPNRSRELDDPPVLTSPMAFRHFVSGSLALASPDPT